MTQNDQVVFRRLLLNGAKLEQKLEQNGEPRTPSCSSRQEASKYVSFDPERQRAKFDLRSRDTRSSWVKTDKKTYHSKRLDEINTIRPRARLHLFSVRSNWQKTPWPHGVPLAQVTETKCTQVTSIGLECENPDVI